MQLQFLFSFIGTGDIAAAASCLITSSLALLAAVVIPCLILLIRNIRAAAAGGRGCSGLVQPPGSQGWLPVVGETWEYGKPNQSLSFMQRRVHKYGELFRSHLFGAPIIVSCSGKVNQFICQQEHKLFKSNYPRSFMSILGEKSILGLHKELHRTVRGPLVSTLASKLRSKEEISDISRTVRQTLQRWDGRVVCVHEELGKMAYAIAAKRLLGVDAIRNPQCQTLRALYFQLIHGLVSIPINIPGMAYHKSMTARAKIVKIIDDMIAQRKAHPNPTSQDFLDALIKEEDKVDTSITSEVMRDTILSALFASHDSISRAMTCAVKYLVDNPKVVETLKEEHLRIQGHVKEGDDLNWENYKSMTFSNNVVSEILRITNIAPCVFRDALEDVDIDGFVISKGSKVMAYFSLNHFDPIKFQDPFKFNPWRWEGMSLSDVNFMPFGAGPRLCPGNDFAKLQICIFLHHLILKYRFKPMGENEIIYSPYVHFKKGLPTFFESIE